MGDLSTDMLGVAVNEDNFGFAFNDNDFSDRILRIEIIPEDSSGFSTNKYLKWFSGVHETDSSDSLFSAGAKVNTLSISSPILASKSRFFYKLFKNGMKESQQREVTLRINAYEEAALMELIYFIYHKNVRITSAGDLLDLFMAADKFEVTSCMVYCIRLLIKLPMSLESALLYLDLPSSVLAAKVGQPLLDAAKQYLTTRYKYFTMCQEDAMKLPLSALEVVLGSDGLQVYSENDIYDFILKWARAHYVKLEERREILTKRLAQFISFPDMNCSKLKEVIVCPDFDCEEVSKLILEALCPKEEVPYRQHIHVSKYLTTPQKCSFSGRVYYDRPIKVMHLEFPKPHCVVYFDLKKDDCANVLPSRRLYSEEFLFCQRRFSLLVQGGLIFNNGNNNVERFGLFVKKRKGLDCWGLDIEFAVMKKSSKEFERKKKVNGVCLRDVEWGERDLLRIPWADFMSDNSEYFIDGMLHLRAEFMLK